MKKNGLKSVVLGVATLCLASLPSWGNVSGTPNFQDQPVPGALNYVEGSAYLEGHQLNGSNLGSNTMDAGQVLHTAKGKAEVLLTPGVFLRVNDDSSVKMISPELTNTEVELLGGEAGIEVDEIHPQNNLEIIDNGVTTRLAKTGFYEFLASQPDNQAKVLVFSGKALVDTGDGQHEDLGKGREVALVPNAETKPGKFKTNDAQDGLANWSRLRSEYMAEQNERLAANYGWDWAPYPGWYRNPWGWGWWGPGLGLWGAYPGPVFYGGYHHFGPYEGHRFYSQPRRVGSFHGGTGLGAGIGGSFHGGERHR